MKCEHKFLRARQPEQKEQRREQILAATALLLDRDGFDKVSLNAIARESKTAKSNVYRYFESREDIFLQLLKEDWIAWIDRTEEELKPYHGSNDCDAVAKVVTQAICESERMCQLISVLASVLENNLSEKSLYAFKIESVQLGMRLLGNMNAALPNIHSDKLMPAVQGLFALIAGLWPLGNPSPLVEKVMERPELAPFKMEFKVALGHSIQLMLRGASMND